MPQYEKKQSLLDGSLFSTFYSLQLSANRRFQSTFTLVFIHVPVDRIERWEAYLQNKIRDTDIAFRFPIPHPYVVLLSNAHETDAEIFVKRILEGWRQVEGINDLVCSILPVSSGQATCKEVLQVGRAALKEVPMSEKNLPYVLDRKFASRERGQIKVSIIEEDSIITRVLSNLLERSVIDEVEIDLRVFHDGYEFLQSDWYQSAQTHIVIMNDILPKKTGIEVLQALRAMPNERKFHIFMMTKRMSEEEMIYAYEHGLDEYIIKPFNPKLFEAQVKKLLRRLYT